MKLDSAQIAHIKDFISHRGFTYYDLQLEIIDHMACKVEELMTADGTLSLDAAIQKAHGQFGVLGFSVVEDNMRAMLQKKYLRLFRKKFLTYLQPVYLPLIAGFIYLFYITAKAINSPLNFFYGTWVLLFALFFINALADYRNQRRYRKMLTARMGNFIIVIFNVVLQLFNVGNMLSKRYISLNAGGTGLALGVFMAVAIISFIVIRQLQKIAIENCRELEQQYQLTLGAGFKL